MEAYTATWVKSDEEQHDSPSSDGNLIVIQISPGGSGLKLYLYAQICFLDQGYYTITTEEIHSNLVTELLESYAQLWYTWWFQQRHKCQNPDNKPAEGIRRRI